MALTKNDLEDMMKRQKEERVEEMKLLKTLLMEGVKKEITEQISTIREEMDEKVTAVREEFANKFLAIDQKHSEVSDVQSVLDCKVDRLEEEIKTLRELTKNRFSENVSNDYSDSSSDTSEDVSKLVEYTVKVIGFKPIEHRDVLRLKRMHDIEDNLMAKKYCLKEFWKCELRMPGAVIEDLLENIVTVWSPTEDDWDILYVEFTDEKSVKVCYSYCKFLRNKESKILQFFPPEFWDQYRALDLEQSSI